MKTTTCADIALLVLVHYFVYFSSIPVIGLSLISAYCLIYSPSRLFLKIDELIELILVTITTVIFAIVDLCYACTKKK